MKFIYAMCWAALLCCCFACKKFLDEKPNKSFSIPATLKDCQALLDDWNRLNAVDPVAGEISADDYFLTENSYAALTSDTYRRMYLWQKDNIFPPSPNDWSTLYRCIYQANTVLETVEKIKRTAANDPEWTSIRGQALVFRARAFLVAAWQWAPAWDAATAGTDLGIPLRLSSDFNQVSVRATVQQTYTEILSAFGEAVTLLPATARHPLRPSKPAAYALLARTYLSMRQYEKAGLYADSCLQLRSTLLDYNTLDPGVQNPFPQFNTEVIFDTRNGTLGPLTFIYAKIDTTLYDSYAANDLRKTLFFRRNADNTLYFRGSYEGDFSLFSGPTTAEMYLVRAEANARQGSTAAALSDLNTVLMKRWKTGTFTPLTAATPGETLQLVLAERRKELVMRLLRFIDIKRLNREGFGITQTRVLNNQVYTLPPNDPHYALPIPEEVITLGGIQQNPK
ncbi:MAG TPA: RagB/SusD family nutrient uptake outer membrane protein [Flavisolibacter sp.]|nr:RagB/SusD family nutrient uptake outer membrane protein [Flavisolibacter sp.]